MESVDFPASKELGFVLSCKKIPKIYTFYCFTIGKRVDRISHPAIKDTVHIGFSDIQYVGRDFGCYELVQINHPLDLSPCSMASDFRGFRIRIFHG